MCKQKQYEGTEKAKTYDKAAGGVPGDKYLRHQLALHIQLLELLRPVGDTRTRRKHTSKKPHQSDTPFASFSQEIEHSFTKWLIAMYNVQGKEK